MDSETFRPQQPKKDKAADIPQPTSNMPPQLQAMLKKAAEASKEGEYTPPQGPRLAYTGNAKLDELLAGIKESIYTYEEKILPSRGKFYDESVAPANGIIHVRCMTGEEEQILATPRHTKKGQAINMIFRNCVREPIVPEKLLTIDRTWLLIFLRGISYTSDYEVKVRCTECGTNFQTTIDLDHLMVNPCPDNFGQEQLVDTLPKSNYKFTYHLPTGRDENVIQEHRDRRINNQVDGGIDDTWAFRASILIDDLEGLTDQPSIQTLVTRLHVQDVSYLRTLMTEPPFGVDTKVTVVCASCGEPFQVEMPMDTNFFFPKTRKGKKDTTA